jgi:hypothetical protein
MCAVICHTLLAGHCLQVWNRVGKTVHRSSCSLSMGQCSHDPGQSVREAIGERISRWSRRWAGSNQRTSSLPAERVQTTEETRTGEAAVDEAKPNNAMETGDQGSTCSVHVVVEHTNERKDLIQRYPKSVQITLSHESVVYTVSINWVIHRFVCYAWALVISDSCRMYVAASWCKFL